MDDSVCRSGITRARARGREKREARRGFVWANKKMRKMIVSMVRFHLVLSWRRRRCGILFCIVLCGKEPTVLRKTNEWRAICVYLCVFKKTRQPNRQNTVRLSYQRILWVCMFVHYKRAFATTDKHIRAHTLTLTQHRARARDGRREKAVAVCVCVRAGMCCTKHTEHFGLIVGTIKFSL